MSKLSIGKPFIRRMFIDPLENLEVVTLRVFSKVSLSEPLTKKAIDTIMWRQGGQPEATESSFLDM